MWNKLNMLKPRCLKWWNACNVQDGEMLFLSKCCKYPNLRTCGFKVFRIVSQSKTLDLKGGTLEIFQSRIFCEFCICNISQEISISTFEHFTHCNILTCGPQMFKLSPFLTQGGMLIIIKKSECLLFQILKCVEWLSMLTCCLLLKCWIRLNLRTCGFKMLKVFHVRFPHVWIVGRCRHFNPACSETQAFPTFK